MYTGVRCRSLGRRIIAGCSNTMKVGVSLHKFPSDGCIRKQWISEVKITRVDWKEPSVCSLVYSDHFSEDSFESMAGKLGLKRNRVLSQMLFQLSSHNYLVLPRLPESLQHMQNENELE